MNEEQKKLVKEIFERHPEIVVAYLFGSRARGTAGPMSDYDFALQTLDGIDSFDFSSGIGTEISAVLGTDAVDVVILNTVKDPVLKREAVLLGECLYTGDMLSRYKVEQGVLREYEDTRYLRSVQGAILHEQICGGALGKPVFQR
jgi:predicted nucleotidyltransferase